MNVAVVTGCSYTLGNFRERSGSFIVILQMLILNRISSVHTSGIVCSLLYSRKLMIYISEKLTKMQLQFYLPDMFMNPEGQCRLGLRRKVSCVCMLDEM